jgi:hypothetical protein
MTDIWVSELPVYSNHTIMPIGSDVSIIDDKYTKVKINKSGGIGKIVTDESKLMKGKLVDRKVLSEGHYSSKQEFTVKLEDGEEKKFMINEYQFKVEKKQAGGRRKRTTHKRKRSTRKTRGRKH